MYSDTDHKKFEKKKQIGKNYQIISHTYMANNLMGGKHFLTAMFADWVLEFSLLWMRCKYTIHLRACNNSCSVN